jgi:hypothetical protein
MKTHIKTLKDALSLLSRLPYEEILQELEKHQETTKRLPQQFKITFANRRLSVNGITIIHENTEWINCIFRVLFKQRLNDIYAGKFGDEFTFLSMRQITKALELEGKTISHQEQQVRSPIYKIRKRIKNAFKSADINDFIEIRRSNGADDKEFGYRLNPFRTTL